MCIRDRRIGAIIRGQIIGRRQPRREAMLALPQFADLEALHIGQRGARRQRAPPALGAIDLQHQRATGQRGGIALDAHQRLVAAL